MISGHIPGDRMRYNYSLSISLILQLFYVKEISRFKGIIFLALLQGRVRIFLTK